MSRILNRRRQLAEQGRIRLGYTAPASNGKTKPVRSETFILTSHSREHVEHAASLWGGAVEHWQPQGTGAKQYRVITEATAIPAILPPGDPLSQAYEMWSKGGCQRRCDGVTEEFSGNPCICLTQHGEQWYELGPRDVCVSKSRLKVLLPDMQGLGSWRLETGSFYATDEIAGMVDTIRGAVGEGVLVPVSLRIEQRTRVAGGQTKHFTVPVLELRGVTAGALLSGQATVTGALGSSQSAQPRAIEAGPSSDPYASARQEVTDATTLEELAGIWDQLKDQGLVGPASAATAAREAFVEGWKARAHEIKSAQPALVAEQSAAGPASDDGGDPDVVWQRILATAGSFDDPWTTSQVVNDFEQRYALNPGSASAGELQAYLELLKNGVPA